MTTNEQNLVVNNLNMAHDIAWRYYKKFSTYADYEDFKSEALLGLTKAAKTFNPNLKLAFSTYAYRVMQNEILQYLRQFRKIPTISIYSETGDNLEILDKLASNIDIEEDLFDEVCLKELYDCIEGLPERLKTIIRYRLNGMTMVEIGEKLNLSQPQISRDYHLAINRLKTKLKDWR